eukprot:Amastigsp_a4425_7.p4 type:complete len:116 gc:universal Amastigsp_a4425_7:650-303(-)
MCVLCPAAGPRSTPPRTKAMSKRSSSLSSRVQRSRSALQRATRRFSTRIAKATKRQSHSFSMRSRSRFDRRWRASSSMLRLRGLMRDDMLALNAFKVEAQQALVRKQLDVAISAR